MNTLNSRTLSPNIVLGVEDHRKLTALALAGSGHTSDAADDLLNELDRARVLPQEKLPGDIVRMGSTLRYRDDAGRERQVTLVFPADADIAAGRISVLTPVGTALIGLRAGQSITWLSRDGKRHALTLLSVGVEQTASA